MKIYIYKYHTLSVLDSFENGILPLLDAPVGKNLIEPDYSGIIPASYLRRMSKVIRMGAGTALKVMQNETEIPAGVIVGSGLGCYDNSILFTKEIVSKPVGSLSPTAFIQSADNTIAGLIAIILKNNAYNNTFLHKGLAFENALLDAILLADEKEEPVLVGAVDEWISSFEINKETKKIHSDYFIGEGASFFLIGKEKRQSRAVINGFKTSCDSFDNLEANIQLFLSENNLSEPQLILHGNSFVNENSIQFILNHIPKINYSLLSGIYFTNTAFAVQLAAEIVSNPDSEVSKKYTSERILIINNFYDSDFSFIYLSSGK